jgi:hypothetical protein
MYSEVEAGYFTALVYSVLLNAGKSVFKITETLWEDSLIIVKDVRIIHVNLTVIAITVSEKILRHYFRTVPCILLKVSVI